MSSRLYPGFGSGKKPFEGEFEARPMPTDSDEVSCGDKVILPQSALKEIRRLRLPLPLLFEVISSKRLRARLATPTPPLPTAGSRTRRRPAGRSTGGGKARGGGKLGVTGKSTSSTSSTTSSTTSPSKATPTKEPFRQFCGVLEFSAPPGVCYMPKWMLKNLRIKPGIKVTLLSQKDPPKGKFARFRPHESAFVDLAAGLGPREVMEAAMRFFSVLSVGETIQVAVAGERFKLDVLEVQPGTHVCLYGDLDLEVDFAPPKDSLPSPKKKAEGGGGGGSGGGESLTSPSTHSSSPRPSSTSTPTSASRHVSGRGAAGVVRGLRRRREERKKGGGEAVEKEVVEVEESRRNDRDVSAKRWAMAILRERKSTTTQSPPTLPKTTISSSPLGITKTTTTATTESSSSSSSSKPWGGVARRAASGTLITPPTPPPHPSPHVTPPRPMLDVEDDDEGGGSKRKKGSSSSSSSSSSPMGSPGARARKRAAAMREARMKVAKAARERIARKRRELEERGDTSPTSSPFSSASSRPSSPVSVGVEKGAKSPVRRIQRGKR